VHPVPGSGGDALAEGGVVHRNSLSAYHSEDFNPREQAIVACLDASSVPLTAREIAGRLGFQDLNAVKPRLTRLKDIHAVCEAGDVRCPVSGKTVSTYALVRRLHAVQESLW
jgi:hypothetical protein